MYGITDFYGHKNMISYKTCTQNILHLVLGLEWNMIPMLLGLGLEFRETFFHFLKHSTLWEYNITTQFFFDILSVHMN